MIRELITKNRSYRRFDQSQPIGKDTLVQLIDLARLSATAANLQTLRFFLVHEPQDCELLFPHLKWAGYLRYWDGPPHGERPTAYILILSPTQTSKFHLTDTGIAAQSILLGATELGLGGCMIASVDKTAVHELFQLPGQLEIVLALALGKPVEEVVIEDVTDPEDIEYWRDEAGVHHVPKRSLQDLILNH